MPLLPPNRWGWEVVRNLPPAKAGRWAPPTYPPVTLLISPLVLTFHNHSKVEANPARQIDAASQAVCPYLGLSRCEHRILLGF